METERDPWEDRPVPGARLAAFWLAFGRSEESVRTGLIIDLRLDEDAADAAIHQAHAWLQG